MTVPRSMKCAGQQFAILSRRKNQYGGQRCRDMQAVVSEYRDYLDMCGKLDYDLNNSFVFYSADLQKFLDKVAYRVKIKADAQMRHDFQTAMRAITASAPVPTAS